MIGRSFDQHNVNSHICHSPHNNLRVSAKPLKQRLHLLFHTPAMADDDLFDGALNLEDRSYEEGYQLGVADGSHAGRIEGRVFGLEKGFQKFLEAGRLHGKACSWGARISGDASTPASQDNAETPAADDSATTGASSPTSTKADAAMKLPLLGKNQRLEKHILALYQLVDPETMATANTEEVVNDFDDRYRRALAKSKIIESIIGEQPGAVGSNSEEAAAQRASRSTGPAQSERHIEDFSFEIKG